MEVGMLDIVKAYGDSDRKFAIAIIDERNKKGFFAEYRDIGATPELAHMYSGSKMNRMITDLSCNKVIFTLSYSAYKKFKPFNSFWRQFPGLLERDLKLSPEVSGRFRGHLIAINPIYQEAVDSLREKFRI